MPGEAVIVPRFCTDPFTGDGEVSLKALEDGGIASGAVQHHLLIYVLRAMAASLMFPPHDGAVLGDACRHRGFTLITHPGTGFTSCLRYRSSSFSASMQSWCTFRSPARLVQTLTARPMKNAAFFEPTCQARHCERERDGQPAGAGSRDDRPAVSRVCIIMPTAGGTAQGVPTCFHCSRRKVYGAAPQKRHVQAARCSLAGADVRERVLRGSHDDAGPQSGMPCVKYVQAEARVPHPKEAELRVQEAACPAVARVGRLRGRHVAVLHGEVHDRPLPEALRCHALTIVPHLTPACRTNTASCTTSFLHAVRPRVSHAA